MWGVLFFFPVVTTETGGQRAQLWTAEQQQNYENQELKIRSIDENNSMKGVVLNVTKWWNMLLYTLLFNCAEIFLHFPSSRYLGVVEIKIKCILKYLTIILQKDASYFLFRNHFVSLDLLCDFSFYSLTVSQTFVRYSCMQDGQWLFLDTAVSSAGVGGRTDAVSHWKTVLLTQGWK